jgi:APA family basic amino acid/polyamine antiporter
LGEALAWFIGWNLLLEYAISASAVAVSWSAYVINLLEQANIHLPAALINAPFTQSADGHLVATGALINLPAVLIILAMTVILYVGVRESAGANTFMVALKVAIIVVFIAVGFRYVDTGNWHPYIPQNTGTFGQFGWSGVLRGAAVIFFSYVGFDTASTTALEARNPQRDVPLGILGALAISAVLYVGMSAVMTGMVPFQKLNVDAPVAVAIDAHPQLAWLGVLVKIGAIAGMTSVILTSLLGQPRILLAMADDGLLPPSMSRCHPRYKTPHVSTVITGVGAALIAGVFPLDVLAELISIGILLAFAVVCIGVLVLRRTRPDAPRPFRVPWAPFTCILGALVCLGTTLTLGWPTWIRLAIWTVIGMSIYAFYGYRHSRLRK